MAFSQERGYPAKRLYAWRRRLFGDEGTAAETSTAIPLGSPAELTLPLLPLRLSTSAPPGGQTEPSEDPLEMVLAPRRRFRLPNDFDEGTLVRFLRVLDAEVVC